MIMSISYRTIIRNSFFKIFSRITCFIPKQNNLVLLTAWLGEKYIDNTKYVFEFLQNYPQYKAVWMTNNRNIYDYLQSMYLPVALSHSLNGFWLQLRARVVFSSIQFADYNQWLLNRCIYIDLGHGHPIKDPGKEHFTEESRLIDSLILEKVKYYAIVASDFAKDLYPQVISIPKEQILISDFARNDVFIDSSLRNGKNAIIEKYRELKRRVVTYMPTHREMGRVEMKMSDILPLDILQVFCENNNVQFIIKKHFYHRNETEDLEKYPNIVDITNVEDIDPQVLLYQTDILVTDYSACYIDYLLLNRPLLFYQYDLEFFTKNERSLYMSFKDIDIAPVTYSKDALVHDLSFLIENEGDKYTLRRNAFAKTYFNNLSQKDGRKKVVDIMEELIEKYAK